MIRAIFACDEDWGIGKSGTLPWPHQPEDQKWFKECTKNSTVVMGRVTWEDPDMPKPLPNRENIVISTKEVSEGYDVKLTLDEALAMLPNLNRKDIWVIGGAQMFELLIDIIDEVWISRITGIYDCDTHLDDKLIGEKFKFAKWEESDVLTIEKYSRR